MRTAVAVVAVAVLAWLGVMERNVRLHASGVEAAGRGDLVRAEADLRAARLLNPDPSPDLGLAFVHGGRGERRRAVERVEDVLRREPDNLAAWGLLYQFTHEHDRAAAARALAALRRLDPVAAADR